MDLITEIFDISFIIISSIAVIFDSILLIIYLKNGIKGLLSIYKIVLLIICLLDSLCNIVIDPVLYLQFKTLCTITGALKTSLITGILTTQVVLVVITYFYFQHPICVGKHSKLFQRLTFLMCFAPLIISFIIQVYDLYHPKEKVERTFYCIKTTPHLLSFESIIQLIDYILFSVFLCKLYSSIKRVFNDSYIQNDSVKKYKSYLKHYFLGFLFSITTISFIIIYLILLIADYFEVGGQAEGEEKTEPWVRIISLIYYAQVGLSPIIVMIVYCFKKEHYKMMKVMFCCKKEETINITKQTAFLFDTSVISIRNGDSLIINSSITNL